MFPELLTNPQSLQAWLEAMNRGAVGPDAGPGLPPVDGTDPDALEAFIRDNDLDGGDFATQLRDLQSDLVDDPQALEQLNGIRRQLGLEPIDHAGQAGLQDLDSLKGEDLVALLVMWALRQGQNGGQQPGQMHSGGFPQTNFANSRSIDWGHGGIGNHHGGAHGPSGHAGHTHGAGSSATGGGNPAPTAIPGGPVPDVPGDVGPVVPGQNGVPSGLQPNAARGAAMVRQVFGFNGTIHGVGQRSGTSDHPHGNAIDVMTGTGNMEQGQQIADFFRQNHDELGVKYVIFNQRIASPRTGWQWEAMEDRGGATANHLDHPHISFH